MRLFMVSLTLFSILVRTAEQQELTSRFSKCGQNLQRVDSLVRRWAPLVWLAPGERYFPGNVSEFLNHVTPRENGGRSNRVTLPEGPASEFWYLVTNRSVESLLRNPLSVLHGTSPARTPVPVYAMVSVCQAGDENSVEEEPAPPFHVTYWMFYPYNLGKSVCTLDVGVLGTWPLPDLNGHCLGLLRQYGNHVGDWEHVSIVFSNGGIPTAMYVSTHDAGAFYKFNPRTLSFDYEKQDVRSRMLQRPNFPLHVNLTSTGGHPILFSARGSHGLWSAPGKHRFVKLPRLYDETGFGVRWATWENIQVMHSSCGAQLPYWMAFRGRWGNPRRRCHPVIRLGINVCEYSDGPTGIPMKRNNFKCSQES